MSWDYVWGHGIFETMILFGTISETMIFFGDYFWHNDIVWDYF